jgi:hypothetical protein
MLHVLVAIVGKLKKEDQSSSAFTNMAQRGVEQMKTQLGMVIV